MPAGRPTKYNKKILTDTADYLENHADYEDIVPSVAGLSCYLKLSKKIIYIWAKQDDKEEFLHMLEEIASKQERMLLSGGLSSDMNATIVKLMLAKHNYSEKTEATVIINPLTEVINQISGNTIGPKTSD
jgi:hypothetical protein